MHALKKAILAQFRKNQTSLSTTQLVNAIFEVECKQLNDDLEFSSHADAKKTYMEKKALLHRKLLHHINVLVADQILRIASIENKGEKVFILNKQHHEELVYTQRQERVVLPATSAHSTPIDGFATEGVLSKYANPNWIEQVNSILVDPQRFSSLEHLLHSIVSFFQHVNDVIALNDFEKVVQKYSIDHLLIFLEKLIKESQDYDKTICLIFDLTNVTDDVKLLEFFSILTKKNDSHILVVLDATNQELILHRQFFESIATLYTQYNLKLNIKNDDVHKSIYFVGKLGPYTIPVYAWREYVKNYYSYASGIVVGQATVVIDVNRFLDKYRQASQFFNGIHNIAKTLFMVNSSQRKNSSEYFRHFLSDMTFAGNTFFYFAHCYIRFLNYTKLPASHDLRSFQLLLQTAIIQTQEFVKRQQWVYVSCGMPLRFHLTFSQAYRRFSDTPQHFENYKPILIKQGSDLYSEEFRKNMMEAQSFASIFSGGYEVRIYREGTVTSQEAIGECLLIMNTYKVPFICYRFQVQHPYDMNLNVFLPRGIR